jgi:IS1 family transposase
MDLVYLESGHTDRHAVCQCQSGVACRSFVSRLSQLTRTRGLSDEWKSYAKSVPPQRHRVGKRGTMHIERKNLSFKTHIKRLKGGTIRFSKTFRLQAQ